MEFTGNSEVTMSPPEALPQVYPLEKPCNTFMSIEITWGSCQNGNSESVMSEMGLAILYFSHLG